MGQLMSHGNSFFYAQIKKGKIRCIDCILLSSSFYQYQNSLFIESMDTRIIECYLISCAGTINIYLFIYLFLPNKGPVKLNF